MKGGRSIFTEGEYASRSWAPERAAIMRAAIDARDLLAGARSIMQLAARHQRQGLEVDLVHELARAEVLFTRAARIARLGSEKCDALAAKVP